MKKRIKSGFQLELLSKDDGVNTIVAQEHSGVLRLTEMGECVFDAVDLSAAQCEALGMTVVLEDVPEPWQILRDVVLNAAAEFTPTGNGGEVILMTERNWLQAVAALCSKV